MAKKDKKQTEEIKLSPIERLTMELEKIQTKTFKIMFWVLDTKGNPNGSISYTYQTAFVLQEMGYEVLMLHQDSDFVGVSEWLGDKYAKLPHANIEKDNVSINVSDFLIIPEVFANVMNQTIKLPCKRIILCQNFNFIPEFIPTGRSWGDYGILDVITTSKTQENLIKEIFPYMKTKVVEPSIAPYFRKPVGEKELVISIVSKDQSNINRIVKPFYWKFPLYKWISFKDLRGMPQESYAEVIRESAIVIWIDEDTNFGYAPIEAMKCGSIVIGKIPETVPDWMYDETGTNLANNGIWIDNLNDIHKILASVVQAWMNDEVPEELLSDMDKMKDKFTREIQKQQIEEVYGGFIKDREQEIVETIDRIKKEIESKMPVKDNNEIKAEKE